MGFLRLALAFLIMLAHLGPSMASGYFPHVAVLAFYVLAGYTATASIQGPYKCRAGAFMASRIARLWPSYLAIFVPSLLWLRWAGSWGSVGLPAIWRILPESLMLVQAGIPSPVPTGWVLPWFLLGYGAIALGAMATPQRAGIALLGSLLLSQWSSFNASFAAYYYSPMFAALGFAVGGSAWHLGIVLPRDVRRAAMAGALSYPLFLCHYLIGAVVATALNLAPGWPLFFATLPPTLALSWLLVVAVERPIAHYRKTFQTPSTEN